MTTATGMRSCRFPVHFDFSALWFKDRKWVLDALSTQPAYLRNHEHDTGMVTDYRCVLAVGAAFRQLTIMMF